MMTYLSHKCWMNPKKMKVFYYYHPKEDDLILKHMENIDLRCDLYDLIFKLPHLEDLGS
jgi:hypothetical protein